MDSARSPILRSDRDPAFGTRHSGPGKGNQLDLRGFDLDPGTDFAVQFDGVLVDFRKGPYRSEVGDFQSAGSAFLRTFDDPFCLDADLLHLRKGRGFGRV